jgi:2,3-bisphosphoglycerate-independent phosphoglycerate mutase
MPRVLLVLLDGVGAGSRDPSVNPLAHSGVRFLANFEDDAPGKPLPRGGRFVPLDACLGVAGLPQSATGQTAIFTGVNAPALLGMHLPGFPNERLRDVLRERSVLKRAAEAGRRVAFLNAYRPRFFELGEAVWRRPMSATSWANRAAGLPFRTLDDLRDGRALYHEFTNAELRHRGLDVPERRPEEAGAILAALAGGLDLALYEFFRTDLAGHSREMGFALEEVARFELMLEACLAATDLEESAVLVVSDHGNLEDLSFRGHTRNPAQALVFGAGVNAAQLHDLTDVARTIDSK